MKLTNTSCYTLNGTTWIYEIEPEVWGRVGPDPQLQPQVDTPRGLQARLLHYPNVGAGRPECRTSLGSDIIRNRSWA